MSNSTHEVPQQNQNRDYGVIRSHLGGARNLILGSSIIVIIGAVGFTLIDGLEPSTPVWVLACLVALAFWKFAGDFVSKPAQGLRSNLKWMMISFWVISLAALFTDYLTWGMLYPETLIATGILIFCGYQMIQFISEANLLLE